MEFQIPLIAPSTPACAPQLTQETIAKQLSLAKLTKTAFILKRRV